MSHSTGPFATEEHALGDGDTTSTGEVASSETTAGQRIHQFVQTLSKTASTKHRHYRLHSADN